jgi:hypothetical protein
LAEIDDSKAKIEEQMKADFDLGVKIPSLVEKKELIQALIRTALLHSNKEEIGVLCEKLSLFVEMFQIIKNSEFIKQLELQKKLIESVQGKELTDQDKEELDSRFKKECPLLVRFFELSTDLEAFQAGLMNGFELVSWDKVLVAVSNGLQV